MGKNTSKGKKGPETETGRDPLTEFLREESPNSSADRRGNGDGRVSSSLGGSPESGGEENGGEKRLQPGENNPDRHWRSVRSHAESPGQLPKRSRLPFFPDSSIHPEGPESGRVDSASLFERRVHRADAGGLGGSYRTGCPGILPGSGIPIEGKIDEVVRRVSQTSH